MIARRRLSRHFAAWNRRWDAPFGSPLSQTIRAILGARTEGALHRMLPSVRGPFGVQPNNTTRRVEYPWAFHSVPLRPGLHVLEIGGGLSGFQFVLSRTGCRVVNVDPGMDAFPAWPVNHASIARLNRAFGTDVVLHNCYLEEARLPAASFDIVFSISVLEHISVDMLPQMVREIFALLKPGGYLVVTLDLFLNLAPFCSRQSNKYGSNIPATIVAQSAPFELVQGDPREMYGFPEFDADHVLANLDLFMVGDYPALSQLMLLRKPEHSGITAAIALPPG